MLAEKRYVSPLLFAQFQTQMGNVDKAFEYLEQGYELRCGYMLFIINMFEPLRSDPRWDDLVERVGIADQIRQI